MLPLSPLLLQSRGCVALPLTAPSHLQVNGATPLISSVCPFHLRLWRPLQPLSNGCNSMELNHGIGGNFLNRPCDGSVPSAAAHGTPKYAGFNSEAESLVEPSKEFLSVTEIENAASRRGLTLCMKTVGPFFRVRVLDLQSKEVLGAAQGFVKFWTCGRILHLDSIRLSPLSLKADKPIFGIAFLLGAAAVRHGYDQKCIKAELLAIKDTVAYHSKLVRYYSRMGFRSVYDVTGESLQDIPHMLIWGGVGTRMDASIEELLRKWSPAFKRVSK